MATYYTWLLGHGASCGHEHPTEAAALDCYEIRECPTHRNDESRLGLVMREEKA